MLRTTPISGSHCMTVHVYIYVYVYKADLHLLCESDCDRLELVRCITNNGTEEL